MLETFENKRKQKDFWKFLTFCCKFQISNFDLVLSGKKYKIWIIFSDKRISVWYFFYWFQDLSGKSKLSKGKLSLINFKILDSRSFYNDHVIYLFIYLFIYLYLLTTWPEYAQNMQHIKWIKWLGIIKICSYLIVPTLHRHYSGLVQTK